MIIELNNFGPISNVKIDLSKNLTMLYGENSVGKSYIMFSVYNILNSLSTNDFMDNKKKISSYYESTFVNSKNKILIKEIKKDTESNITNRVEKLLEYFLKKTFIEKLENSFKNTFLDITSLRNIYSKKDFSITIQLDSYIIFLVQKQNRITIKKVKILKQISCRCEKNKDQIDEFRVFSNGEFFFTLGVDRLAPILMLQIHSDLLREIRKETNNIYFFPASRIGLYEGLNSFSPIIAELSKSRFYINKKIELPALSNPNSDYFINMSLVKQRKINRRFAKITKNIESKVLKGRIKIDENNGKVFFIPNNSKIQLDLSVSSSMVASIGLLVTYLKYIVKNDLNEYLDNRFIFSREELPKIKKDYENSYNILFIEEPEAHLHPKSQVILMKILEELTKHKIKLIITSHSNYMFNQLVNNILANNISSQEINIIHLSMSDKGSCNKNDMVANSEGIPDRNFSEVSEQLLNQRMSLYKKFE